MSDMMSMDGGVKKMIGGGTSRMDGCPAMEGEVAMDLQCRDVFDDGLGDDGLTEIEIYPRGSM
jgi:hypothetical protein